MDITQIGFIIRIFVTSVETECHQVGNYHCRSVAITWHLYLTLHVLTGHVYFNMETLYWLKY